MPHVPTTSSDPPIHCLHLTPFKAALTKTNTLPEVLSAKEMEVNWVNLGGMNMQLLKKVEELTLYVIEQSKRIDQQQKQIEMWSKEIDT